MMRAAPELGHRWEILGDSDRPCPGASHTLRQGAETVGDEGRLLLTYSHLRAEDFLSGHALSAGAKNLFLNLTPLR